MTLPHIAVIILNYNSEKDLQVCAEQIARQVGIQLSIILIDNASKHTSLEFIKTWLTTWRPDAVYGTENEVCSIVQEHSESVRQATTVYLITSLENHGYSAGNNIGIRLADLISADAVLIANPDMRIENRHYLKELTNHLFAAPKNYIAASRILGLDGKDQNPLREATFLEEFFWIRTFFRLIFRPISYVLPCQKTTPHIVPKVSGCCLMLKMEFLKRTNYLDEKVFLYCEEPILSARVESLGGAILYVPSVTAIHAHNSSEKENNAKRMQLFIKSRKYYLETYSSYGALKLRFLFMSYALLSAYNRFKRVIFK